MSRVTYTDTATTPEQQALRDQYGLRVVKLDEEGSGVNALPGGVYGFTYSPGLVNAPVFATRRYHSYETHKHINGDTFVLGFASAELAAKVADGAGEVVLELFPEPGGEATTLVCLPYARILGNRQHAAPNQDFFTATVAPLSGI